MALQWTGVLVAQDNMGDAYEVGSKSYSFTFTDTQNTQYFSNDYGLSTNDVYYKFTLTTTMDVFIHHCGSEVNDTYLYLLDESGNIVYYNDDYYYDFCSSPLNSLIISDELPAGTYYVVSEGNDNINNNNGNITTTITGYSDFQPINSSFSNPIPVTTNSSGFTFTDTQNTADYMNNLESRDPSDVFYRFTISTPMAITIDHCGSELYDTYLHVFNGSGEEIYWNDDDWTYQYCSNQMNSFIYIPELPAGTYYVVSEGYSNNGIITTKINGFVPITKNPQNWTNTIDIGLKNNTFEHVDSKNTSNYINSYIGQFSKDVVYKFTLNVDMSVTVSHCGSEVGDTYLHLLNVNGDPIVSNNNYTGVEQCANTQHAFFKINLKPGIYYVVSEGNNSNGNITTSIKGVALLDKTASSWLNPIDIGEKVYSFEYTDTKNTTNYPNAYNGQVSNDVLYKFKLNMSMDIILSHCGSALSDTYLHILNSDGNRLDFNNDYSGDGKCENNLHAYLKTNLSAGSYYVVSEGYSQNGNITTNITGICPLPANGVYDGSAVTNSANAGTNYILSINPTVATSDVSTLGVNESLQTVQYFDGLGRSIQTVQRGITPTKQDLATFTEYDGAGREWKQWLPKSHNGSGAFVDATTFKDVSQAEYGTDSRPYNEAIIEPSPLNRVLGNKGPGAAWENKPSIIGYDTNDGSVAYFLVDNNGNLKRDGYYAQGSLYKTVSKDEDGKTVEEYKDKLGQVILKRSKNGTENVNTYFVNNDLGQLAYVIPPTAADGLGASAVIQDDNDLLKKFGYLYKYDERGNCIQKRLPGCDWINMVYDKADRLVLSQDGNQRAKATKEWTAMKYDILGRVIFTGITMQLSGSEHTSLISSYKNELIVETIDNNGVYSAAKFQGATPLTINYYDNYFFISSLPINKQLVGYQVKTGYDKVYPTEATNATGLNAKGLLTGTRTYLLDGSGNYSATAIYYDYRGRVVQTRASNHLDGFDIAYNQYKFSGQIEKSLKEHNIAGQGAITELYTNDYDHAGRLKFIKYKINDKPEVLLVDNSAADAYDELGRLRKKKRHNNTDTEEFDYNIRNWATRIKSGGFEEKLYYNTDLPTGATAYYNGNIAAQTWTYQSSTNSYRFQYDNLNRLKDAISPNNTFNESFNYDKMGNINFLKRLSNGVTVDQLTEFAYKGNQLNNIVDEYGSRGQYYLKEYHDISKVGTPEMAYDSNGNLIKDLDRDIVTIKYNLLNLPDIIQFKNGNQIRNLYDASGQKLNTRNYTVSNVIQPIIGVGEIYDIYDMDQNSTSLYIFGDDYIGNMQYRYYEEYNHGVLNENGIFLMQVNNPEGYCDNINYLKLNYYRRDHLGNNREVWRAPYSVGSTNYAAATIQRTQYYPSGLPWASNSGDNPGVQNKKYNGKEFVEMHGLDEYDSEARWYIPSSVRTPTMDPLCEKHYNISPYAWCGNNPLNRIDPNGMDDYRYDDKTGEFHLMNQTKDETDRVLGCHLNKKTGEYEQNTKWYQTKTRMDGVEKGILSDGVNFMKDDKVIPIGGESKATVDGVEAFAVDLSEMVGKEISGAYFSKDGAETTTHISIGNYQSNKLTYSGSSGHNLWQRMNPDSELQNSLTGFFHTHPTDGYSESARTTSSGQDRSTRDKALKFMPHLQFYILTRPINYGDKFPYKKEYTTE